MTRKCLQTSALLVLLLLLPVHKPSAGTRAVSEQDRFQGLGQEPSAALIAFRRHLHDANFGREPIATVIAREYEQYKKASGNGSCKTDAPTAQLHDAFAAALIASQGTAEASYLDDLQACHTQLKLRGANQRSEDVLLYKALVRHREFVAAARFSNEHAELRLPPVPPVIDDRQTLASEKPSALRVVHERNGTRLVRDEIDLHKPKQIVVVASANCHFSQDAISELEKDSDLKARLAGAMWLAPLDDLLQFSEMQNWNEQHPYAELQVPYRKSELHGLDLTETPVFFILEDGKIVDSLAGWPGPQQRDQLKFLLKRHGF